MHRVDAPDPSWLVAVQSRRAVLWLGPETVEETSGGDRALIRRLLLRPWSAVVVDSRPLGLRDIVEEIGRHGPLLFRYFEDEPGSPRLPENRLPVYALRGSSGKAYPGGVPSPNSQLVRYQMLQRVDPDQIIIAVGASSTEGLAGLKEASELTGPFDTLVFVANDLPNRPEVDALADTVFQWPADAEALATFVADAEIAEESETQHVAVRTTHGVEVVDLGGTVDESYPITANFEWVPASASLGQSQQTSELLRQFVEDPAADWDAYAAGIPFPRVEEQSRQLVRLLRRFERDAYDATSTAWLTAEEGSGATTALRQLAMTAARQGYPVLVAKRDVKKFDFTQLSGFLTRASQRFADAGAAPELPWLLLFDMDHAMIHSEFVHGVASGLGKLMRPALVVAVKPSGRFAPEEWTGAKGVNHTLDPPLTNTITSEEAVRIGTHLSQMLPPEHRRSPEEWVQFATESVRTSMEGRHSLFWVALRFWLFRLPGTGEPFRRWLYEKVRHAAEKEAFLLPGVLEVATMARHRLVTPGDLMNAEARAAVRGLARDTTNAIGLRRVSLGIPDGYTFAHPLIAEEILRIAVDDPEMLKSVEKDACVGLLDLELHLLGRLIRRPAAGSPSCVEVIEELVTSGLRVDPREAPRNYQVRDRIVALLESAPDSLFDSSQVFNHHLAKARRHLAADPPAKPSWDLEARREQLELAEYHLLDALERIRPEEPERQERPLNLRVSLALTLDVRARLEAEHGNEQEAERFRDRAENSYAAAQAWDPDNSYVLENFARFKINRAQNEEQPGTKVALLVEAISLLQWQQQIATSAERDEPILSQLARAYELLEAGLGRNLLEDLANEGSEAAAVALAKLLLRQDTREDDLTEAEFRLRSIPSSVRTWRSLFALYQVVSQLRPYDFVERHEILEALAADPDFAWPLQLMLERGILLYQVGDPQLRRKGRDVFREVRNQLTERSATIRVPPEMKFLADPATGYREKLLTSMVVKNVSNVGRNYFAVPHGWHDLDVPFRPYRFGGNIRKGDERDCYIQFTNFGPQAVPPTES